MPCRSFPEASENAAYEHAAHYDADHILDVIEDVIGEHRKHDCADRRDGRAIARVGDRLFLGRHLAGKQDEEIAQQNGRTCDRVGAGRRNDCAETGDQDNDRDARGQDQRNQFGKGVVRLFQSRYEIEGRDADHYRYDREKQIEKR